MKKRRKRKTEKKKKTKKENIASCSSSNSLTTSKVLHYAVYNTPTKSMAILILNARGGTRPYEAFSTIPLSLFYIST